MCWLRRVLFQCLNSCSRVPHELKYLCNVSNAVAVLLNHRNTFASDPACFASRASFVSPLKTRVFASASFFFPTAVLTVDGESPRTFAMSSRIRSESRLTGAKSRVSRLSTMAFASSWPWFRAIQNGEPVTAPKASGM